MLKQTSSNTKIIRSVYMKSLVIAEKPSVARDIARVLGANRKMVVFSKAKTM